MNLTLKGLSMKKTYGEWPVADLQPDNFKLRKLVVNLGNAYVRLAARDRRKIIRALEQFAFGKTSSVSYRDPWFKGHMKCCYLQLQPISQKMANNFRRWASELLKTGHNNRLALKSLIDELFCRQWIEEP
jgi:hypothetical protein